MSEGQACGDRRPPATNPYTNTQTTNIKLGYAIKIKGYTYS